MREVAFIKKNKENWMSIEEEIESSIDYKPDELSDLYIKLLNDLAFSQTYYPKSKLTVYLNDLALKAYFQIYSIKKNDWNRPLNFFRYEIPMIMYRNKNFFGLAFIVFFLFTAIGVFSSIKDDHFVRQILGDQYVDMTLSNIEKGDPVAVYKGGSEWGSFFGITFNNLRVGLLSYISGVLLGIGTVYILMKNCVMLGSFQYMFYDYGVFWESVRGIWIHGSMEIFAMVIEAGAGFMLGASIIFTGTFSRIESIKKGAKDSCKVVLATIPFTVAAGFLEGYITRLAGVVPNWVCVLIILTTLFNITFYFIIYPYMVNKEIKNKSHLLLKLSKG